MENKHNKVLCIVAHPDDEVLGLGGTLIKHSINKDSVNIVFFADGEGAKDKQKNINRLNNAEKCSKIMGTNIYKIFDYPDQKLDTVPKLDIIQNIEIIISDIKPDIIYTHHIGDINHDHQIIGHAVLTAARPINKDILRAEVRLFETPSSTEQSPHIEQYMFKPNFYVSIEDEWNKKVEAMKAYKKELKIIPHPRSLKSIEALALKRGAESGLLKAEAFTSIRRIWI
jgi:LmbE family N-acetylglucosaminyl deacetylase